MKYLTYVNNINTHEGGTHLSGFRRGLTHTLKKYAETSGMLDKVKFDVSGDDFLYMIQHKILQKPHNLVEFDKGIVVVGSLFNTQSFVF